MFNKSILKNFVSKQLEKQAAEQAKQQAMQQQQMPPQQQQMPMAQAGVSVKDEYPIITGFNPNAGVDSRFVKDFSTRVVEPGVHGRNVIYEGPSNEGKVIEETGHDKEFVDPRVISDVNLKNATDVKFEGTIEDKEKLLRKLNRQNFFGAHGFRGKGWKAGLSDEEIQEFKEENPFYKKDRVREVSYDLTNPDASRQIYYNEPDRYRFQSGGPTFPEGWIYEKQHKGIADAQLNWNRPQTEDEAWWDKYLVSGLKRNLTDYELDKMASRENQDWYGKRNFQPPLDDDLFGGWYGGVGVDLYVPHRFTKGYPAPYLGYSTENGQIVHGPMPGWNKERGGSVHKYENGGSPLTAFTGRPSFDNGGENYTERSLRIAKEANARKPIINPGDDFEYMWGEDGNYYQRAVNSNDEWIKMDSNSQMARSISNVFETIEWPEATETSEGIYYDPIRGAGDTIDGQQYFYPNRANIVYEEDDIYESIFDPRVSDKERKNYLARKAYNDAVAAREARIAQIEDAKAAYARYKVALADSTVNNADALDAFLEDSADFQYARKYLPDVSDEDAKKFTGKTKTHGKTGSGEFYSVSHRYDPTADLSEYYPEEVPALELPYPNIQYNLSDLPEDVDEGQFRQWINTYYPDYAEEHGIDPTVPRNAMNNVIKSAWYELGNEYNPFVHLPLKEARLPEVEVDRDIVRPKPQEEGPRVVRIDQPGYIDSYNVMDTPQGPIRQRRYANKPGYYNLDTGTYMGSDYVPPMQFNPESIDVNFLANLFSKENGGSVRKLKLPKAQDGGFNWGPTDSAERKKLYNYKTSQEVPDMILTLKDDKEFIDGIANWEMVSDVEINPAFNDQIKNRLYSGKWGYNPKTGYLVNLAKAKAQDKVTSLPESEKKYLKDRETFWKDEMADFEKDRVPVTIANNEAWVPDFEFQTYNGTMNSLDVMRRNQESGSYGQTVYMTPQEKATYEKKMMQNNWEHTVDHPLWTLPGQIYLGAFAGPATLTNTMRGTRPLLRGGKNIYDKYARSSKLLDKGVRAVTQNSPRTQNALLNASKYGTIENALAAKNVPLAGYYGYKTFTEPSWTNAGLAAYGASGVLWPFMMNKMYP